MVTDFTRAIHFLRRNSLYGPTSGELGLALYEAGLEDSIEARILLSDAFTGSLQPHEKSHIFTAKRKRFRWTGLTPAQYDAIRADLPNVVVHQGKGTRHYRERLAQPGAMTVPMFAEKHGLRLSVASALRKGSNWGWFIYQPWDPDYPSEEASTAKKSNTRAMSDDDVRVARKQFAAKEVSIKQLSERHGCSVVAIRLMLIGRTYKGVE